MFLTFFRSAWIDKSKPFPMDMAIHREQKMQILFWKLLTSDPSELIEAWS